jgi:hypothetical protein
LTTTRKSNTNITVILEIIAITVLKNLILTLKDEISILSKYRITSNELMFVRTLLILQDEEEESLFQDYIESLRDCSISVKEVIESLQGKGIILKSFHCPKEGEAFNPYEIPFNKNFIKNIYKCSFELGKELFEEYPQFGNIQGSVVPLRSVARKFDSLEDCYFRYGRSIRWNQEKHNHIIELVRWGKENNIINQSLANFVINQAWIDLEALKNGDTANINYDTVKLL